MARIRVQSPNGDTGSIEEADWPEAQQNGFTRITEASEHPVLAGANKALNALSFGASDYAVSPENREYVKALRAENPVAAEIGSVAGTVAGVMVLPEMEAIGPFGKLAVEGGLAGLGPQISEAALSNRDINKELLAADVAVGALTNVLVGGAVVGAGSLASKAAGKAAEVAASDVVRSAASSLRGKVLKGTLHASEEALALGDRAGVFAAVDHQGAAALAGEVQTKAGTKAGQILDQVVQQSPSFQPYVRQWEDLILQPASPARNMRLERLEKQMVELFPQGGVTVAAKGQKSMADAFLESAKDYRLAQELYNSAQAADVPFNVGKAAQRAVFAGAVGGPVAAGVEAGVDVLGHAASRRAGYAAARGLEALAEGKVVPGALKALQGRIDDALRTAPGILGPYATVLAGASAAGADELFRTHAALAAGPGGDDYLARLGLRNETPEESRAYGQKIATLDALEKQQDQFQRSVDKSVKAFVKGHEVEAPAAPMTKAEFGEKLAALEKFIRDPSAQMRPTYTDVAEHAPGLNVQAMQAGALVAKFLYDKAPKPADTWKPESLRVPFEPSEAEIERWGRYVTAATDPTSVVRDLARGRASAEAVEVMKTLYPTVYANVQAKVLAEIQSLKKPLEYEKQLALAQALGPSVLRVTPQQTMLLQMVHQKQRQVAPAPASNDGRQIVDSAKNMQTQTQRLEGRQ